MKSKVLILLYFIVTTLQVFSQNDSVAKMEISSEVKTNYAKSRQSVKINPLLFLRGDIPIYFEKNLYNNFALELGFGFTLRDYMADLDDDISWQNEDKVVMASKVGYSYRLGVRYYASDYSFEDEGMYFELMHRGQSYNAELEEVDGVKDLKKTLNRTNYDFLLSLGYVFMFEENAYIDPYLSFGIRARNYDNVELGTKDNTMIYSIENESDYVPSIGLGIKFGIVF